MMAIQESSTMSEIMQTEMALAQLLRRDGCTVILSTDGIDVTATVYYKGADIGGGNGLTVYEALSKAVSELYPLTPGELDKRFDEILEVLNDES